MEGDRESGDRKDVLKEGEEGRRKPARRRQRRENGGGLPSDLRKREAREHLLTEGALERRSCAS